MTTTPIEVVITGLGATTPVGGDVASTWEAMLAGFGAGLSFAAQVVICP